MVYNSVQFIQDLARLFFSGAALAGFLFVVAFVVAFALCVAVDFVKLLFGRLD